MTEEQLADIEARANAATPGPWFREEGHRFQVIAAAPFEHADGGWMHAYPAQIGGTRQIEEDGVLRGSIEDDWYCYTDQDAEFIASAREDVPALIAEVRRLRGLVN